MNYLSLFSGVEGGGLALQHLIEPNLQCIGYVEIDDYCQRIIQQRIIDGFVDRAPIFGDVKAFINQGYAEAYKGMVDVITAGFPCQPFSVAGKQKGEQDERNLWPATIECIRIIRPKFAYLENVPGLLAPVRRTEPKSGITVRTMSYAGRVLGDLAETGYNAQWCVLGADDCGAPHRRKRWWIVAESTSK